MPDENKPNGSGKNNKNGEVKVPPRGWLVWILLAGLVPLLFVVSKNKETKYPLLPRNKLIELFEAGRIAHGTIVYNAQSSILQEIKGTYFETNKLGEKVETPFRTKTKLQDELEADLLNSGKFDTEEP